MSVVELEKVSKDHDLGGPVHALENVTLRVERGDFLVIIGPSGSGKTSLLNVVGCIERPTAGSVRIDGREMTTLSSDELARVRASKLGFVFQTFNLFPVLTVAENVEFPLQFRALSNAEKKERVFRSLEAVGMDRYARHNPRQLSGGQRQRVAIARALVGEPTLILADEPTANLDHANGLEVLKLMKDLNEKRGVTFVFSTHDQQIMKLASRVLELMDGHLLEGEIRNR
jgi:putative ABC transport system ATP-binding protein